MCFLGLGDGFLVAFFIGLNVDGVVEGAVVGLAGELRGVLRRTEAEGLERPLVEGSLYLPSIESGARVEIVRIDLDDGPEARWARVG